jgi:hypothetical protein
VLLTAAALAASALLLMVVYSRSMGHGRHNMDVNGVINAKDNDDERREDEARKTTESTTESTTPEDTAVDLANLTGKAISTCNRSSYENSSYQLYTSGVEWSFKLTAVFPEVTEGMPILTTSCDAFSVTVDQDKKVKFELHGVVLNVELRGEPGMEVTSTRPLMTDVPFHIVLSKKKKKLCIAVMPDKSNVSAAARYIKATKVDWTEDADEMCSEWSRDERFYQSNPVGGLCFGDDAEQCGGASSNASRRLVEAATTSEEAQTLRGRKLTDGAAGGTGGVAGSGSLPNGWEYKQTTGSISVYVLLSGVDFDKLQDTPGMTSAFRSAIDESLLISAGWTVALENIKTIFEGGVNDTIALTQIDPFNLAEIDQIYGKLANSELSSIITDRINQIPGAKAVCEDPDECELKAHARPFPGVVRCDEYFKPEEHLKSSGGGSCFGLSCDELCFPKTQCTNVQCPADTLIGKSAESKTCKGKEECYDTCCYVDCAIHECPPSACGEKSGARSALPSLADDTCCDMPYPPCCTDDCSFCNACQSCTTKEEWCDKVANKTDPSCEPDPFEGSECHFSLQSTFDNGLGTPISGSAVVYGGTRVFSGGFGSQPKVQEPRLWVWELNTGKSVYNFSTTSAVMSVAAASDSIHALSGEMNGKVKVWNYVEGGPESASTNGEGSEVLYIAGGTNYRQSYINGGKFTLYWKWGSTPVKVPMVEQDMEAAKKKAGEKKNGIIQNITTNELFTEQQVEKAQGLLSQEGVTIGDLAKDKLDLENIDATDLTEKMRQKGLFPLTTVKAVIQMPGNSNFVSGDAEGVIRFYNQHNLQKIVPAFKALDAAVSCLATFPTGNKILIGGANGFVKLWDASKGKDGFLKEYDLQFAGPVDCILVLGEYFYVASADRHIRKLKVNVPSRESNVCRYDAGAGVMNIAPNPGNPGQLLASLEDGTVRVYKV